MKQKPLEYLDPARVKNIPVNYRAAHEFCFYLHDGMAALLHEGERKQINKINMTFESEEDATLFKGADDPIQFLIAAGEEKVAKRLVLNTVTIAVYSDYLHFLFEALTALEKRKFTVALSLLRKPLRENLMFSAWLMADNKDFYQRLKGGPSKFMESRELSVDRRKELLQQSIISSECENFFSSERLYQIIFDKNNPSGFARIFDKATHLVTSHPAMKTEEFELNLLFKDPFDNDIYETLYIDLAYVLMFSNVLMISLYSEISEINQSYLDQTLLTIIGAYTGLFLKGQNPISSELNRSLKDFLYCSQCGGELKIRKGNAVKFFLFEIIDCMNCGAEGQFPLQWLLAQAKVRVKENNNQGC